MSIILQLHTAQAVTIRSITVDQDRIAANSAIQQSGIAGSAVAEAPAVRITDAFGNPVSGIDVVFGITEGGGSITGNMTVTTGPDGIASIEGWTLGAIAGVNTIEASNSGYIGSPVTFTATGTAGAAAKVVLTRESAGTASGSAFTTQPQVTIQDAEGNTVSSSQAQVMATVSTGGTLVGATTVTATHGVATFTDLGISGTSGTPYTITYSATGLTAATQNVTVSTGAAAKLAITTQPVGGKSGSALATQPVIEVQDASGNVVTSSTATVSVAIKSGTGGTLGGTKSVTASNGVATFSGLILAGTAGTAYTLEFTAPGLTDVTSATLTVTPGAAAKVVLTRESAGTASGSAFTTQPQVTIQDAEGNTVSSSQAQVTATVSTGGTLVGATTVTATNGVATFTDLGISGTAGTPYTITYSATGLTAATQNVTVSAGAVSASNSTVSANPATVKADGKSSSTITVTLKDEQGNAVSNKTVTLSQGTMGSSTIGAPSGASTLNGEVTFTVTSTIAESVIYTANVEETSITDTADVTFSVVIGDAYQGGLVFYILQPGDPGYKPGETHGLIASKADQSPGIQWFNESYTNTGATSVEIGFGNINTEKIISAQGPGSYAAQVCAVYSVTENGVTYDDWFLPSLYELNKLYQQRVAVGGFADYYYWSSSDFSEYKAWMIDFVNGNQFDYFKNVSARVRAVRAF